MERPVHHMTHEEEKELMEEMANYKYPKEQSTKELPDDIKKILGDNYTAKEKPEEKFDTTEQPSSNQLTEEDNQNTPTISDKPMQKRIPGKPRKASLQEYKGAFLIVPKITDRRTVFISNDIREQIVSIVRKLGTEKSSVSGFIENLLKHHLQQYKDDIEKWIKL